MKVRGEGLSTRGRSVVRWLRAVGALLLVVAAVEYFVVPQVVTGFADISLLRDLSTWLLALAVLVEALSLLAYTAMSQQLVGPDRLPIWTQLRIDLTGYGASHVVPGGGATAAALRFRLMVVRGVPDAVAASLAGVQTVLAVLGLVAVWALGSLLAIPRTGSVGTVLLLTALALLASASVRWLADGGDVPPVLRRAIRRLLSSAPTRLRAGVTPVLRSARSTLRDTDRLRAGLAWSAGNWLLDALCLWLCLRGYGEDVPPELVLVAYGVAMLAGLLPLTPGGLGIVEGLLVPGLVAAGAAAGPAVLAALTWRLLQFWIPIPVAALCWLSLRVRPGTGPMDPGPTSHGVEASDPDRRPGLAHNVEAEAETWVSTRRRRHSCARHSTS